MPRKATEGREDLLRLTVWGYSPSWWESDGDRSEETHGMVVILNLQSGREMIVGV